MPFCWFLGRAVSSGSVYVNPPLGARYSPVLSRWYAGGGVRGRVKGRALG